MSDASTLTAAPMSEGSLVALVGSLGVRTGVGWVVYGAEADKGVIESVTEAGGEMLPLEAG